MNTELQETRFRQFAPSQDDATASGAHAPSSYTAGGRPNLSGDRPPLYMLGQFHDAFGVLPRLNGLRFIYNGPGPNRHGEIDLLHFSIDLYDGRGRRVYRGFVAVISEIFTRTKPGAQP